MNDIQHLDATQIRRKLENKKRNDIFVRLCDRSLRTRLGEHYNFVSFIASCSERHMDWNPALWRWWPSSSVAEAASPTQAAGTLTSFSLLQSSLLHPKCLARCCSQLAPSPSPSRRTGSSTQGCLSAAHQQERKTRQKQRQRPASQPLSRGSISSLDERQSSH